MKEKTKTAPLCRGAILIRRLTIPLIVIGLLYMIFYIDGLDCAQILSMRDALLEMTEDLLAATVCSFGGIFVFDLAYKRDNHDD